MDVLTERELTRLTYLFSSMCAAPERSLRFVKAVLESPFPPANFKYVLLELLNVLNKYQGKEITKEMLYEVGHELALHEDENIKRSGNMLIHSLDLCR